MRVDTFLQRHYSAQVGESAVGHAVAMVIGGTMMAVGLGLALSIVFLPVGTVIGLLGLFIFAGGVFGHIKRPVKVRDLGDALIGFAGAAIGLTFALAVVFFLVTFGVGTFAGIIEWLRQVI